MCVILVRILISTIVLIHKRNINIKVTKIVPILGAESLLDLQINCVFLSSQKKIIL